MSPTLAAGKRFRRPLIFVTEMMYRFLAPVLSAQFITAATGRPSETRNLLPLAPPLPRFDMINVRDQQLTHGRILGVVGKVTGRDLERSEEVRYARICRAEWDMAALADQKQTTGRTDGGQAVKFNISNLFEINNNTGVNRGYSESTNFLKSLYRLCN